MSFYDTQNQYRKTVVEVHTFDDGSKELFRFDSELVNPPCQTGECRAADYDTTRCEFDPKAGTCGGRMP
jgi:hypothetical protein